MDFYGQTFSKSSSEPYDLVRTLRMTGYGMLILGPSLHFWFNMMSKLFPKRDLMIMGQLLWKNSKRHSNTQDIKQHGNSTNLGIDKQS